jgi:tetratricopeptide (TPR) repeat protein
MELLDQNNRNEAITHFCLAWIDYTTAKEICSATNTEERKEALKHFIDQNVVDNFKLTNPEMVGRTNTLETGDAYYCKALNSLDNMEKINLLDKAIEICRKFSPMTLAELQQLANSYYIRGMANYESGFIAKALTDLAAATIFIPTNPDYKENFDKVFTQVKLGIDKADQYYADGLSEEQTDKRITKFTQAIEISEQFYTKDYLNKDLCLPNLSKYTRCYLERAKSYYDKGLFELAVLDYTKIPEDIYLDVNDYLNRGNAYIQVGDAEKAIADYLIMIELYPYEAFFYRNLGWAYKVLAANKHNKLSAEEVLNLHKTAWMNLKKAIAKGDDKLDIHAFSL